MLACLAALCTLGACSPTYNWREWRQDGALLQALMPCKPEQADRSVPMGGTQVVLHMHSCEAGAVRFALAWADLDDAARAPQALAAWQLASLRSIRAESTGTKSLSSEPALAVKGADAVLETDAQGVDHQGQGVHTRALYFARGHQIYQAAVFGPRLPDDAVTPFFEGLRLP